MKNMYSTRYLKYILCRVHNGNIYHNAMYLIRVISLARVIWINVHQINCVNLKQITDNISKSAGIKIIMVKEKQWRDRQTFVIFVEILYNWKYSPHFYFCNFWPHCLVADLRLGEFFFYNALTKNTTVSEQI